MQASYVIACILGLASCLWLLIDDSTSDVLLPIGPDNVTSTEVINSEPVEFYALAAMMGGGAAMTVILSLTSAADLIHDNTVCADLFPF